MRLPFKGLYPLTQEYGVNPDYYKQFLVLYPDGVKRPMKGHNGLDFGTPYRTEIIAPHSGEIIEATLDQKGYGYYVKIENEQEGSVLAHLDTIDVKVGFLLNEGDHIGYSDSTGYSTGNHLHWGWYRKPRNRANGIAGFEDQTLELGKVGVFLKLNELPKVNQQKQPDQVPSGKLYTQEEYDAVMKDRNQFWQERDAARTERDEALKKLKVVQDNYDLVNGKYTGFVAMGYDSVDDVTAALNKKDETMTGVKQQLVSAMQRNKTLAELLAQKDGEDVTAIEDGLNAVEEVKKLREDVANIVKATGAEKPSINSILNRVFILKDIGEKWFKKIEEEQQRRVEEKKVISDNVKPVQKSESKSILDFFSL